MRGDCSFVVEEAEAWILWELTEAHQTKSVFSQPLESKNRESFRKTILIFY